LDAHPVVAFVNTNVAVPGVIPVTIPPFVTVATDGLLLTHVPPVLGVNVVVAPWQMVAPPVIVTTGFGSTAITALATAVQPIVFVIVT